MAEQPLLEIRNLSLACQQADGTSLSLVHKLNLQLLRGQSLGLLGESGSGKSLTALALLGLLPPGIRRTAGSVHFAGHELQDLSEKQLRHFRGGRIALVFQDPATALNPVLRVGYQIDEVLRLHRQLDKQQRKREIVRLLKEVQLPEPESMGRRYPHEMSGGQRQRIMIAMALAGEPELLVADEPTTALDVTVQAEILKLVASIREKRSLSMLWISHDLAVVAQCCEKIAVLYRGDLVEQGSVEQVLRYPQHQHTRFLLDSIPKRQIFKTAPETAAGPLLQVRQLQVRYPKKRNLLGRPIEWNTAVDRVDLDLCRGQTLAVVGESGSGKTSLARALLQLAPSHGGTAQFHLKCGAKADLLTAKGADLKALRREISLIFQDPYGSLNPLWRVEEIIAEPLQIHCAFNRDERRQRVEELLTSVQLPPEYLHRKPAQLSGGQRQRVAIARALALNPALVICDEAVSALDLGVQAAILELLRELQQQFGIAYLFITHDLAVVEQIADQIVVMKDGKMIETGSVDEVFLSPTNPYTQRLLAAAPTLPSVP
ncbi:MAG: ABC transporter ATP-binding protein [Planctomycetes bacterium]|nr:ABC transporter ATP-binding protein [Planctomycetota bacterium]